MGADRDVGPAAPPRAEARVVAGDVVGAGRPGAAAYPVIRAEALGIDDLLVAQRWWGNAEEIEGSSYDCLAMTAFYAAHTTRMRLITAVHPGFFLRLQSPSGAPPSTA